MDEQGKNPNNEIGEALKEFEAKSEPSLAPAATTTPKHEVEGISFDTPGYGALKFYHEKDTPKMIQFVLKHSGGAIKDEGQAEYVLLGFVAILVAASLYLLYGSVIQGGPQPLNKSQIEQIRKNQLGV